MDDREREVSDATQRMAKVLGAEFVLHGAAKPRPVGEVTEAAAAAGASEYHAWIKSHDNSGRDTREMCRRIYLAMHQASVPDDAIEEFFETLDGWERAYPLSAFPEPDLAKADALLKAGGMTLDAISASNMRHVVSQLAPLARAALAKSRGGDEEIADLPRLIELQRTAAPDNPGDDGWNAGLMRAADMLRAALNSEPKSAERKGE